MLNICLIGLELLCIYNDLYFFCNIFFYDFFHVMFCNMKHVIPKLFTFFKNLFFFLIRSDFLIKDDLQPNDI